MPPASLTSDVYKLLYPAWILLITRLYPAWILHVHLTAVSRLDTVVRIPPGYCYLASRLEGHVLLVHFPPPAWRF